MNLKCPICMKVVSVDDALAGKKATCPFCRQVFAVPGVAAPAPKYAAAAPRYAQAAPQPAMAPYRAQLPAQAGSMAPPVPPLPGAAPRRGLQMPAFVKKIPWEKMPWRRIPWNRIPWNRIPWKLPNLYGYAAVGFGVAAFPLAVLFASEGFGIALAIVALLLGTAGLAIHYIYKQPSPVLSGIGLAAGLAVLLGLVQDIKRADLASRASAVATTLLQVEGTKKDAEDLKQKADEEKKQAQKLKQDAIAEPVKILKQVEELKKQADEKFKDADEKLNELVIAPKKLIAEAKKKQDEADDTFQKATAEKNAALVKEKDVLKQLDDVAKEKEQVKKLKGDAEDAQVELKKETEKAQLKLKKDTEEAQAKLQKEKDDADAKLKKEKDDVTKEQQKAKELLEKAQDLQEKVDKAVKTLMSKLKDPDPDVRLKTTKAIANLGTDAPAEAAFAICEATVAPDNKLRQAALLALHAVRPPLFVPVKELTINTQFNQPGVNVAAFAAAKKIAELGKEAAPTTPIFAAYLKTFLILKTPKEADIDTAKFLCATLGKIAPADADALDVLGKIAGYKLDMATENGEDALRHEARTALHQIGTDAAGARKQIVPLLTEGLKEKKADFRKQICDWLAAYGPDAKAAAPELMKLAKDTDETVKDAAAKALKAIQ